MTQQRPGDIPVFFYGGLINEAMQDRVGVHPTRRIVATLSGYGLDIRPYVNLEPRQGEQAFGLVMWVTHADLERLYGQLKIRYDPVAVLVRTIDDQYLPALCYLAADMPEGQADEAHVRMLLEPAERLGFPAWYLDRIRSFLP